MHAFFKVRHALLLMRMMGLQALHWDLGCSQHTLRASVLVRPSHTGAHVSYITRLWLKAHPTGQLPIYLQLDMESRRCACVVFDTLPSSWLT